MNWRHAKVSHGIVFFVIATMFLICTQVGWAEKAKEGSKSSAASNLPQIAMPDAVPVEEAIGYIRVKNLPNVVGTLDKWASMLNPQMAAGSIKAMVGQYMGDPTMGGIDSSRPLLVLLLNPKKYTNPLVLYLPVTQPEKIQKGIQDKGSFTVLKEKTIIAGDDQPSVMKGVEVWSKVKPLASQSMDTDGLFFADVDRIMSVYGADIDQKIKEFQSQLSMMQQQTGQQGMAVQQKQMQAQMDAILKLVKEIKTFALKADVKGQGLVTTVLMEAKPQTDLAGLYSIKSADHHSLIQFVPNGALKASFSGDPESVAEFGSKMTDSFLQKGGMLTPEKIQKVKKYQTLQKEALSGEVAVSLFGPQASGINGVQMYRIKDAKKALEMIRQAAEQVTMASNPAQGLTVTADFKEKARKVGDVDVHTMSVTITSTNPMAAQWMMMFLPGGKMNLEMAIVNDVMIYAFGTSVDQSINSLKSGMGATSLNAFSKFPKNGNVYADIDLIGTIKSIFGPMFAMMAQMMGPGQNPMDALNKVSAPPVTFFATMHDGRMMAKGNLLLETVLKIKEAFSSMMPQPPQTAPQQQM